MRFGDDDFVAILKTNPDYETVYPIVDAEIRPFVRRKMQESHAAWEEVIQDIHVAVWQALPQFLSCAKFHVS